MAASDVARVSIEHWRAVLMLGAMRDGGELNVSCFLGHFERNAGYSGQESNDRDSSEGQGFYHDRRTGIDATSRQKLRSSFRSVFFSCSN